MSCPSGAATIDSRDGDDWMNEAATALAKNSERLTPETLTAS